MLFRSPQKKTNAVIEKKITTSIIIGPKSTDTESIASKVKVNIPVNPTTNKKAPFYKRIVNKLFGKSGRRLPIS